MVEVKTKKKKRRKLIAVKNLKRKEKVVVSLAQLVGVKIEVLKIPNLILIRPFKRKMDTFFLKVLFITRFVGL